MGDPAQLSRRERQIMDCLHARGEATAAGVVEDLPDPPSKTAVRTLLRILEDKGHVTHRKQGREFVYRAVEPRKRAGLSDLRRVLRTYFDGSLETALSAHLADAKVKPGDDELKRLAELIREARKKGQ